MWHPCALEIGWPIVHGFLEPYQSTLIPARLNLKETQKIVNPRIYYFNVDRHDDGRMIKEMD